MSNLFLWISKNNFLDKSYKILYPWMVAGVGAGNIGTTTGCAACGLALHPGRVRPDYNQPTKVSRQVTCCLVKLQVHDTSASTPSPPLSNLTPDPLAWDLPYFATMDQGSRAGRSFWLHNQYTSGSGLKSTWPQIYCDFSPKRGTREIKRLSCLYPHNGSGLKFTPMAP